MSTYVWHTNINGQWVAYTMVNGIEVHREVLSDDQARARKLPKLSRSR